MIVTWKDRGSFGTFQFTGIVKIKGPSNWNRTYTVQDIIFGLRIASAPLLLSASYSADPLLVKVAKTPRSYHSSFIYALPARADSENSEDQTFFKNFEKQEFEAPGLMKTQNHDYCRNIEEL